MHLEQRLAMGAASLREAAWCGLPDSMPHAALLALHARVAGVRPDTCRHPALAQLWGPRFSAHVVAARDFAVFSLGRLPGDERGQRRALSIADRLRSLLHGRQMTYREAGRALRVPPNSLRYAAASGQVQLRWEGSGRPVIWMRSMPRITPSQARAELLRRYLHCFGPATPSAFAKWAGLGPADANATFAANHAELLPVRSALGDSFILAEDESAFVARRAPSTATRLLPSGDSYFLCWGAERSLLVPDPKQRAALWTPRVWPGAVLMNGEVVGTWRRAANRMLLTGWRRWSAREREMIEREVRSLEPAAGVGAIAVAWT